MRIELHIERLLLDQTLLGGERASAVREAIEGELGRLLATPDAASALHGIGHVASLLPLPLPPASHPHDRLGLRVAAAMHSGLGKPPLCAPVVGEPGAKR